jgi:hypothetical protein
MQHGWLSRIMLPLSSANGSLKLPNLPGLDDGCVMIDMSPYLHTIFVTSSDAARSPSAAEPSNRTQRHRAKRPNQRRPTTSHNAISQAETRPVIPSLHQHGSQVPGINSRGHARDSRAATCAIKRRPMARRPFRERGERWTGSSTSLDADAA